MPTDLSLSHQSSLSTAVTLIDATDAPEISLIVCTLDEADSIAGVLREAASVLAPWRHEIIVVDDSAGDATAQAVLAVAATVPGIHLLHRRGGQGLASAVIEGWTMATGHWLGVADGDGQHDLQILPQMLSLIADDQTDLVAASRYIRGETGLGGVRDAMSRAATRGTNSLLRGDLTDPMSGFFVITRACFEDAQPRLSGVGFKILVDVAASCTRRLRVAEVPAALRRREHGVSKMDLRVVADLGGLLVEKATRGLISAQLAMFGAVGVSGMVVHMAILGGLHDLLPFAVAQGGAILVAMTWNFWINNVLTFRDRRLHGASLWRGLLIFYAACLLGAVISEGLSALLDSQGVPWLGAGVAGALAAGVCNYYTSRTATWGASRSDPEQQLIPAE